MKCANRCQCVYYILTAITLCINEWMCLCVCVSRCLILSLWDICYSPLPLAYYRTWHTQTLVGLYIDQTWQIDYAMQQLLNYRHCLFLRSFSLKHCLLLGIFIDIYGKVMHFNWICHWILFFLQTIATFYELNMRLLCLRHIAGQIAFLLMIKSNFWGTQTVMHPARHVYHESDWILRTKMQKNNWNLSHFGQHLAQIWRRFSIPWVKQLCESD